MTYWKKISLELGVEKSTEGTNCPPRGTYFVYEWRRPSGQQLDQLTHPTARGIRIPEDPFPQIQPVISGSSLVNWIFAGGRPSLGSSL